MPNAKLDMSEFDALVPTVRQCKVGRFFKELEVEDRAKLIAALQATTPDGKRRYSADVIVKWFKARGLTVGHKAVDAHRKGACCCE